MARKRTPSWIREEGGQSLVIIVLSMVVIIGAAAIAIDVGNWLAKRHRAQVTADAMALAAANYMANNPSATKSAGEGIGDNAQYTNGSGAAPTSATVHVDTGAGTATATVVTSGAISFASALGIGSPTIKTTAVATYEQGTSPFALFADGTCSGPYQGSITLNLNGNVSVTGVHSNGDITGQVGNNTTSTPNTISQGSGCSNSLKDGNSASAPTLPTVPGPNNMSWPVPYDSTSCQLPNGTSCYFDTNAADLNTTCTYVAGNPIPSALQGLITSSGSNITITGSIQLSSPTILCAPGGTITIGANKVTYYGTLYANSVNINGNSLNLTPPPDALGMYVSGTSGLQLNPGNGSGGGSNNVALVGAFIYAPNDTVTLGGNNGSGFIESQSIVVSGNNWSFVGTGPTDKYVFGDTLIQ